MFLRIGLLCTALTGAAVVASETADFKALTHLTSKESLGIIAKLRKIHPDLANYCNENSSVKNKAECDKMLLNLDAGHWIADSTRDHMKAMKIVENPDACGKKYQDPIDCKKCINVDAMAVAQVESALYNALDKKAFKN